MFNISSSRLFQPAKLGSKTIQRISLAPLTRFRVELDSQVPLDFVQEYYSQRSSPGTLLISEGIQVSAEAGGLPAFPVPGIFTDRQFEAWKQVTKSVHEKGSVIFAQIFAVGRANAGGVAEVVSASPIPLKGSTVTPRELTKEEIARYIEQFTQAAVRAIEAGFDGVEIHSANGYLIDQFLQSVSNIRTDSYGSSMENRSRFLFEITKAVVDAIGQEKVGVRFSPWSIFQDMQEPNPVPTFSYATSKLVQDYPSLGYVHFVEPVSSDNSTASPADTLAKGVTPSNDPFRAIVRGIDPAVLPADDSFSFPEADASHPTLFLSAGGYTAESAISKGQRTGDIIVFGRYYISNPDLPSRVRNGIPFAHYDRLTFYTHDKVGYTDYPTSPEEGSKLVQGQA